jgi:hypothetical protein
MPKRTINPISTFAGLVVAAVMIVAGVLLTLGHSSVTSEVQNELTAQKIYFPAANSPQVTKLPATDAAAMSKYAGQLMTTGPQAETYADDLMSVQIRGVGGGLSYAQLATEAAASRKDAKALEIEAANVFRAETIRGQLLNSYAFWKVGQIMLIGAYVAFATAAVLLIVSAFGLARRRQTAAEAETQPKLAPIPAVETA